MKLCPWCNTEYPNEFFEEHHKNHIHEDNSPENLIDICVKCHKRHHFESGYDTVILKKNDVKPRTLEDEMIAIDREEFLKAYRNRQGGIFKDKMKLIVKLDDDITTWAKSNKFETFGGIAKDHSFRYVSGPLDPDEKD